MKQRIVTVIVLTAVCGLLGLAVTAIPTDTFTQVMEHAALLSVGLQQPGESAEIISGWVTKPTAAAPGGALSEQHVILGEVIMQAVAAMPSTAVPEKQAGAGVVLTQQLSAGKEFVQGVAIKNNTKTAADIAAALAHTPDIAYDKTSADIQVLITHTHTTECYLGYDAGFFNPDDQSRTDDAAKNMVAVGERVAQQLRQAGIGVVHDTEIHDQPYSGAYTHSRKAVEKYLAQYPSISVVLDIHRDAIYQADGTRVKPTVVIGGKKAAQMMIIVGMMNTKSVPNPHTAENLSFGARLQQTLHAEYEGLMRPMVLASARYNQQLCNGMILVEVGSDVNTLEEACYSGELLGKGLVQTLKEM
ncbi:MAG: stage II sporulation protein P [Clostridia bacterium]|nr:stage II sporulation protein P [Clostridia bacterium]